MKKVHFSNSPGLLQENYSRNEKLNQQISDKINSDRTFSQWVVQRFRGCGTSEGEWYFVFYSNCSEARINQFEQLWFLCAAAVINTAVQEESTLTIKVSLAKKLWICCCFFLFEKNSERLLIWFCGFSQCKFWKLVAHWAKIRPWQRHILSANLRAIFHATLYFGLVGPSPAV